MQATFCEYPLPRGALPSSRRLVRRRPGLVLPGVSTREEAAVGVVAWRRRRRRIRCARRGIAWRASFAPSSPALLLPPDEFTPLLNTSFVWPNPSLSWSQSPLCRGRQGRRRRRRRKICCCWIQLEGASHLQQWRGCGRERRRRCRRVRRRRCGRVRRRRRRRERRRRCRRVRRSRCRIVQAGRLLYHQGPTPTGTTSSTATAAYSATPEVNTGIFNLQILQHGEIMQHLLEASQIIFSLTCLKNLKYLENLLSQKISRHLFQLGQYICPS